MTRAAWLLAAACGCGPTPLRRGDDLGPAYRVSGPVDPAVALSGRRTRAAVAWAWMDDGAVDGLAVDVPFEPLVYRYAVEVPPPPDPADGQGPEPTDAPPGLTALVGLLFLTEADEGATLEVDAPGLLDWAAGARSDALGLLHVDGGAAAAVTRDHLLLLAASPPDPADPCWLDGVAGGLTLHRRVAVGCSGWEPLAAAGERTEFQGITMGSLAAP